MISWGLIASATAFVQGEIGFDVLRFLLGVAEAGFLPGIILYLTYWFPRARRAKVMALFFLAVPLSSVLGAPISTLLIQNGDGALGFDAGWRFMFFVEGIPVVLVGALVLLLLPEWPSRARWLTATQQHAPGTADRAGGQGPRAVADRAARRPARPAGHRAVGDLLRRRVRALRARVLPPAGGVRAAGAIRRPVLPSSTSG